MTNSIGTTLTKSLLTRLTTVRLMLIDASLTALASLSRTVARCFWELLQRQQELTGLRSTRSMTELCISIPSVKRSKTAGSLTSKDTVLGQIRRSTAFLSPMETSPNPNFLNGSTHPNATNRSWMHTRESVKNEKPSATALTWNTQLQWLWDLSPQEYRQKLCGEKTPNVPINLEGTVRELPQDSVCADSSLKGTMTRALRALYWLVLPKARFFFPRW